MGANLIGTLTLISVNNLQPGESTPKPITPELFGKLGHEESPFDIADHEEIHSFTKVGYGLHKSGRFITNFVGLFLLPENNDSHSVTDWPQV